MGIIVPNCFIAPASIWQVILWMQHYLSSTSLIMQRNWVRIQMFLAADVGYCPVKLGMMSNRLQSGVNTLQGFREDKRNRVSLGTVPLLVHRPLIQLPAALPWADVSVHSVLHQLRAVHLIRAHLRLQLCQHRQGGLWPHPVVLRRRVQSAGLRQVCASVTTNVRQTSHQAFLTAVQMFLSPRASCLGEVAPILTCFTPGTLHLLSVARNYPMALWSICLSAHLESAGFGSWSESDLFFSIYCLRFFCVPLATFPAVCRRSWPSQTSTCTNWQTISWMQWRTESIPNPWRRRSQ